MFCGLPNFSGIQGGILVLHAQLGHSASSFCGFAGDASRK